MATCSDLNRHMEWELAPSHEEREAHPFKAIEVSQELTHHPSAILQLHCHNHVIAKDFIYPRKERRSTVLQFLHAGPMTGVIVSFEKIVQLNLLMRDRSALCVTYLAQIKTHFNAFVHEHQYTIY